MSSLGVLDIYSGIIFGSAGFFIPGVKIQSNSVRPLQRQTECSRVSTENLNLGIPLKK